MNKQQKRDKNNEQILIDEQVKINSPLKSSCS